MTIVVKCLPFLLLALGAPASAQMPRWQAEAARVTITRDDWGIAHVRGRSDADAVFGAIYAQAEDDFPRIEANYLAALGRTAEAEGEEAIWRDLRQRLWIDPIDLQARYRASPAWLRGLMDAWADGLNFYLATHPATKPKVLTHFEPWMALSFTEGSIGGDIERADLGKLAAFYGGTAPKLALAADARRLEEPTGSNGIAIGPKKSADGHALLWINPHTSFFFRSELEMRSDAGLHAYGASTWGQFFLYQGFNERLGWMHTSSGVDAVDEFAETVAGDRYRDGATWRPIMRRSVTIRFRRPDGTLGVRSVQTLATRHGPIVRADGAKWIALALMNKPVPALEQSWLRTKARDYASYLKVAALQANSSNNTIYADADGHIAYLHPQFVPKRADRFDYRAPVDGADPATGWQGLTPLDQLPQLKDPATGWLYNSNDWPWMAAGPMSQHAADFPRYMDQIGPNPRGSHALELLSNASALTPRTLTALAFDPHLPAFEPILFKLFAAYDALPAGDPRRAALAEPIALLRPWDKRWAADSEPTSLAVFFGDALWAVADPRAKAARKPGWDWIAQDASADQFLKALADGAERLRGDWGSLHVAWGRINRFQRVSAAIQPTFSDAQPSIPVPFTSSRWGSLASFGAKQYPGTKSWYGTSGNSFVAVVDFGPKVHAWAVSAGGESGDPASPHFADQATRYATGNLRQVYFWPEELAGHIERSYRPGVIRPTN
ncbi:penicillin acylase family protein [Sphingomonas nostoxanthinifaciens]|uniref:penicillin acylase family protein n=1 Tax=Sphingomonas nostoxanthinifaciens TaxID=2872652 RepID=UPI001CC1F947|nr:penicillin acylase family protein [Sphingomonas nostoxanthinifaciens]UAK24088.1 penicillin acylase family protein [Sphingomonas nostoxanthinifaciens]